MIPPRTPSGKPIQQLTFWTLNGAGSVLTLSPRYRMGELEPWMDENFIKGVFRTCSDQTVNVKVIRDKNSG